MPTVEQAMRRPDCIHWQKAMESEYNSLIENNTWNAVNLSQGHKTIGVKWVLKLKRFPDGRIDKFKARLVVKGYSQVQGLDYDQLFAPVAKKTSLLYFLHHVAVQDLECHVLDYKTAFLNGTLDEEIYIEQPELFHDGTSKVLRLRKALYGLKQAPRQWYKALSGKMKEAGFTFCAVDGAVARLFLAGTTVWVAFYVDDMLVACHHLGVLAAAKRLLLNMYVGTDKGELRNFLGMTIWRDRERRLLYVDQGAYAASLLTKAGLEGVVPKSIPLPPNQHKDPLGSPLSADDVARYRREVGELMYLSNTSRPDLAYGAGYLARHLQQPAHSHLSQLKQVLSYLKGTVNYALTLGKLTSEALTGWVDSDWAQEPGRKSVYGYCFQANGCTFSWKSKRLTTVARSSMEAEFMAAGEAVREAMHLQWLHYFLHDTMVVVNIKVDNASALSHIRNPVLEDIRKHIDVVYNHIRERQDAGYVDFCWVPSADNVADIFTKALPRPAYYKLKDALHLSVSNH
jgi:hypothetical protein